MSTASSGDSQGAGEGGGISGRAVVIGMIVLGIVASASLWTYTWLEMRPYQDLIRALAVEYEPNAIPQQVKAGRHRGGPMTLRVVMRIRFHPDEDPQRVEAMRERIEALAREHQDLSRFEVLEIYFEHRPEGEAPVVREYRTELVDGSAGAG